MHPFHREKALPRRSLKKLISLLIIATGFILTIPIMFIRFRPSQAIISPLPDEKTSKQTTTRQLFQKKKDPSDLRKKIQETVNNRWKNYSVYVKDFSTDFIMDINEMVIFTAASVNKVPIIAALYYYAGKGEIDLDERVTVQPDEIQDFGTGSLRYESPGSVYSLKTLAKLMIGQSDNTAAYILANHVIGVDKIQTLINSWGLTQTDIVNNKTSNKDMELLFEKIYTGQLTSPSSTQEMLAFFKHTDFEDRIPALLPEETSVYHKIGNEIGVLHDVGIVEQSPLVYFIGILSSDITDDKESAQIAAEISKAVYEYLK